MPVLDSLTSSPGRKRLFSHNLESPSLRDKDDIKGETEPHIERDETQRSPRIRRLWSNLLKCEVCSAPFETRRGLSSHARSHLRQLGIGMSESSGAPIDLLYQITKERSLDGHFPPPSPRSCSPSPVVRKAPISSLLPVSSPLRCLDHKPGGMKGTGSNLTAKPFWAPQETDAPLNLSKCVCAPSLSPSLSLSPPLPLSIPFLICAALEVDPNKDIVCQLCGAWFETRKGLSSHARAHLRHFGVEYSESKGSPIDLLNQLIHTDDFKHRASALQPEGLRGNAGLSSPKRSHLASTSPHYRGSSTGDRHGSKATSASASSVFGPPPKRPKSSQLQVFRLSGGELLPIPHSEFVFTRSGGYYTHSPVLSNMCEPVKEIGCEFCGEYFENRKGLSSHARSHLRQMGITEWSVNGSPIDTLRELITRRGLPCALPLKPLTSPPPSPGPPRSPMSSSSSPSLLSRLPFAEPTHASCELCGFYFENRKALASHARAHLRQFGVTEWCVNGSPIETLSAWMRSRPHKVVEMHRGYMQGSARSTPKKVRQDSVHLACKTLLVPVGRSGTGPGPADWPGAHCGLTPDSRGPGVLSSSPGFERRPPKHPSHSEGGERDSGSPKPPRTSTIPALVPKPPCTPLVKVVGKIYNLKCRFCEVEFQGPLSVQEDWIRHLQQHILNLNYNKPPRLGSSADCYEAPSPWEPVLSGPECAIATVPGFAGVPFLLHFRHG
uniref:C2H2-type domain-containing protein n=1 Tax=Esox lucius TaxID=8010 RepID=A0A3P8XZG1_ESOLU